MQGDVNCSGGVDSADALQVLLSVASLPVSADCLAQAANVDCSTQADSIDSLLILRFVASLPVNQPAGCTHIGDPLGPPPSSFDKIDQALADGTIGEETALTYKVFAVFGDGRLPGQYKGDDSRGPMDSFILSDVQSRFDTLSPAAQATLGPFLIPPAYNGSWASPQSAQGSARAQAAESQPVCNELDPNWKWVDAATANVRVWWQASYPEDEAKATDLATAMDSTIWPKLTGLMGEPLSDAAESCNGGNGRLDIYLVVLEGGISVTPGYGCKQTPAYIEFNRSERATKSDLAHEFLHAIQWGYNVKDGCVFDEPPSGYRWLAEATATWAEDYVYPNSNAEWPFAGALLSKPDQPLDTYGGGHEYGAYLFFLYLTRHLASDQIIRTIWNNTAQYGSLEAVNSAIHGGLDEQWPLFAACAWNKPPSDCFAQWDHLDQGVADSVAPQDLDMGAATVSRSLDLTVNVEHMATSYRWFTFTDDRIHSVSFKNTLVGAPHAAVKALVKINGQWQDPSDWTGKATTTFCRDTAAQHIEELVIIISNSDWETKGTLQPASPPVLTVSTSGCASVTLSWDAYVDLALWVIPQPASDAGAAQAQSGQPGFGERSYDDCSLPPKTTYSLAIQGVSADAHYIGVYFQTPCNGNYPDTASFTITIQYPDGHVATESGTLEYFPDDWHLFGPYDFAP